MIIVSVRADVGFQSFFCLLRRFLVTRTDELASAPSCSVEAGVTSVLVFSSSSSAVSRFAFILFRRLLMLLDAVRPPDVAVYSTGFDSL